MCRRPRTRPPRRVVWERRLVSRLPRDRLGFRADRPAAAVHIAGRRAWLLPGRTRADLDRVLRGALVGNERRVPRVRGILARPHLQPRDLSVGARRVRAPPDAVVPRAGALGGRGSGRSGPRRELSERAARGTGRRALDPLSPRWARLATNDRPDRSDRG